MKKLVLLIALSFSTLVNGMSFLDYCKGDIGTNVSIDQAETVAMLKLALSPKAPWPVKITTPVLYGSHGEVIREMNTLSFNGYAIPTTSKFNYKFNNIQEVRSYLLSIFKDKSKCDRMNEKFESMEALQLMSGTFALKSGSFKRYQLKDITPLKGAKNLKYLIINQNKITNADVLGTIKSLQYIKMAKNNVSSLKFVKKLPNLVSLDVSDNSIEDISPLSSAIGLEELWLSTQRPAHKASYYTNPLRKKLEEISALKGLKNLYLLVAGNNNIKDISSIKNLKKLNILSFKNNLIKDINPLKELYSLRNLYLSGNSIEDVLALKDFENLKVLSISNNKIKDCSIITQLPPMKKLVYHKNPCL
ncbi:MAG: leucine-rich repeat domain-containing protein [Bacteriovoracaceae bacterium]